MSARERLEWTLALLDRASGPARKVARGLDAVASAQERVKKAGSGSGGRDPLDMLSRASAQRHTRNQARLGRELERLAQQQGQLTGSTRDWGAMGATAFMAVGAAALAAAAAIGRVGIALGDAVIEAATFREQTMASLETMLGSRDTARATFAFAQRAAQLTPFDTRDVIDHVRTLTTGGFRGQGLNTALALVSDVQAAMGSEAGTTVGRLLSQINSGRKLQADLLESFQIAGIGREPLFEALARQYNVRGSGAARNRGVEALMRQGRFVVQGDDQRTLVAIRDAITSRFSRGGRAGSGAVAQGAASLSGAISNAKSAFFDLLSSIDLAETPGLQSLRRVLVSITDALNPASESGRRLRDAIVGLSNRAGAALESAFGRINVGDVLNRAVSAAQGLGGALQRAWPYAQAWVTGFYGPIVAALRTSVPMLQRFFGFLFQGSPGQVDTLRTIATGLGIVAALAVGALARAIAMVGVLVRVISIPFSIVGAFWGRLIGAFSNVELTFSGIGTAIVNGLKAGITGAWEALLAQIRSLASMLPQVVKDRLGIRSPSRVFAQLGGHVADGFALGIEGGTGGVRSAIGSMVDVGAVGARAASRARGGGAPLALTINVTAPEGADADEWGAIIASAVARELGTRTERVA